MIRLDHIAVAGRTLDEAGELIETALGVPLQPGGKHARFGTYNRLLGLVDGLYIEAIAIDPAAAQPDRARWFDLDRFTGAARLTNWICSTNDLETTLSGFPAGVGEPVALSRGELRWQMAVPESGILPFDNLFPALIRWCGSAHPGTMLATSGCRLHRLVVSHPEAGTLRKWLDPVLHDPRVVIEPGPAGLLAEIDTPHGRRILQ